MAGRGRPGRPSEAWKREQFARLIARGVTSAEACRIVGSSCAMPGLAWICGRPGAASIPDQVQPESPSDTDPAVAACIGVALGLLDDWLTGTSRDTPPGLARRVQLPSGNWTGERAATDILVLARKVRVFASLDTLIARQGGKHVLYGSALTLAGAIQAWAQQTDTPVSDLVQTTVR